MNVKLSDVIESICNTDDLQKLAQDAGVAATPAAGATQTATPESQMIGNTVEDEKAKIEAKLNETAGAQIQAVGNAKPDEVLNTANKAPAGEMMAAKEEAPVAPVAKEAADVIAEVLASMEPAIQKQAAAAISDRLIGMGLIEEEKLASALSPEDAEAFGRISAHYYVDEMNKIAAEVAAAQNEDDDSEVTEEDIAAILGE